MYWTICITSILLFIAFVDAKAETIVFGEGDNTFSVEFVEIGFPGNPPDDDTRLSSPFGSVAYEYQIAKYELPCQPLNIAVQQGAILGVGTDEDLCGANGQLPGQSDVPDLFQFVNWLNTHSGVLPAYYSGSLPWPEDDPGYNPANPMRNTGARYFLPTADEWYKAAYYDPVKEVYYDYATGSDEPPVSVLAGTEPGTAVFCTLGICNSEFSFPLSRAEVDNAGDLSPFGTMGQLGNGGEWEKVLLPIVLEWEHAMKSPARFAIQVQARAQEAGIAGTVTPCR